MPTAQQALKSKAGTTPRALPADLLNILRQIRFLLSVLSETILAENAFVIFVSCLNHRLPAAA